MEVEARKAYAAKNIALCYILWFFLGQLGIHRFYTGRVGSGITQLLLGLIGWATSWLLVGYLLLIPLWIWLFIDIFLIPGMCRHPR
ncbi:TM2 domain-containing protein [Lentibacillus salinarum]|uniref:TM2 domain-containing protein n=1 Tax=Lentibacillus salinarum TaxID=446820 RepID=A0ABW3ZWH1_9BACI